MRIIDELKNRTLENTDKLGPPGVLAVEIVEQLGVVREKFRYVEAALTVCNERLD